MANRREEERERLRQARQEREAAHAKSSRQRLIAGYAIAGVIGLAVLVGIGIAIASSLGKNSGGQSHIEQSSGSTNGLKPDTRKGPAPPPVKVASLRQAAKQAGCDLRLHLKDTGHQHIPPSAPTPNYSTNPPTSGPHVMPPYQQADGAYREMPEEKNMLHSLEHGRIEIQYSPNLSESDQLAMKGLYDTMYGGALLFPNKNMNYAVAVTAWTNLMGCDEYRGAITLDAIRDFGKATWGRYGGENPASFGLLGPTPVNPKS